jgi:hypothetical protein
MSDTFYRDRIDRALIEQENARAARLRALDEALQAVRQLDEDVMESEDLAALNAAQAVVNDLRRTW